MTEREKMENIEASREETTTQKQPHQLGPLSSAQLDRIKRRIYLATRGVKAADAYKVYFIREPASGAIKIGIAAKPRVRMASLQCAHPYALELLAYAKGGLLAEQDLHREFAADRLQGEWFKDTPRLRARIREVCGDDGYMCAEFYMGER